MWHSKLDVYRTEWLDLVFDNRNKSYGAYELRQHNNQTTIKALVTATGLMVSIIMLLFLYSKVDKTLPESIKTPDLEKIVHLSKVFPPKQRENKPLEVEKNSSKPVKVQTRKLINLNVVPSSLVTEEIAPIEELHSSIIGSENVAGPSGTSQKVESSGGGGGAAGNSGSSSGDAIVATELLEKYPEFPGGESAFAKYLSRNLKYPYPAVENNITGRVWVSFVIEKDGSLSGIKVLRGIGGGCDEEAIRVLKKAPAWSPGIQNGRAVRVAYTMPIHFQLSH